MLGRQILFMDAEPSPSGEGVCGPARRRMRGACAEIACLRQGAENCGGVKPPRPSVSKNLPLRGRCPEGAEGENLAIARNISDSRTVLSPTACGRSPLAEGAKG